MSKEEIKAEVEEIMESRGYSLERAIERVARVLLIPEDEVREACA